MSYANLILYGAVLPSYESETKNKKKADEEPQHIIKADDPKNRDEVRKFFDTCD